MACPIKLASPQFLVAEGYQVATAQDITSSQIHAALVQGGSQHALLDGAGAGRVSRRLEEWYWLYRQSYLRPARWADVQLLYDWQQDPGIRAASLQGGTVTWEGHQRWFEKRLRAGNCHTLLAEDGGDIVGVLRLDPAPEADQLVVSLAVTPQARGRGWGGRLLAELFRFVQQHALAKCLRAFIRLDNPASLACFARAGYQPKAETVINGQQAAIYTIEV